MEDRDGGGLPTSALGVLSVWIKRVRTLFIESAGASRDDVSGPTSDGRPDTSENIRRWAVAFD